MQAIESSGFSKLAVRAEHAAAVAVLAVHQDAPFHRLLIAQAGLEPLRVMTAHTLLS